MTYDSRVRAVMDRVCKITALRMQYEVDEDIVRSMMLVLGIPWKERTAEQEKEMEERIDSMATCPKGEGTLAVWCEKQN